MIVLSFLMDVLKLRSQPAQLVSLVLHTCISEGSELDFAQRLQSLG